MYVLHNFSHLTHIYLYIPYSLINSNLIYASLEYLISTELNCSPTSTDEERDYVSLYLIFIN
jgi:hypothetical protein